MSGVVNIVGRDDAGRPVQVKVDSSGSLQVSDQSLAPGDNELLGANETIPGDVGFPFVGVTTGVDINLGAVGAAGDYLGDVTIRNASGSNITQIQFKDGTTVMEGLTDVAALATATSRTLVGPRTKSVNGGWKINITCAGTMASIFGFARGKLS